MLWVLWVPLRCDMPWVPCGVLVGYWLCIVRMRSGIVCRARYGYVCVCYDFQNVTMVRATFPAVAPSATAASPTVSTMSVVPVTVMVRTGGDGRAGCRSAMVLVALVVRQAWRYVYVTQVYACNNVVRRRAKRVGKIRVFCCVRWVGLYVIANGHEYDVGPV